jgi:hypothetical protein
MPSPVSPNGHAGKTTTPSRKAPSGPKSRPAGPPKHFRELLVKSTPEAQAAARALRGAVRTALPAAAESLHSGTGAAAGHALYHVSGRLVCGIHPTASSTLLQVHGVTQDDSPDLKLGGSKKEGRHVRFGSANDVRDQAAAIRALLLKAARR